MGQGFPSANAPLVNDQNFATPVWLRFFQTLWQRTGGASGGVQTPTGGTMQFAGSEIPDGWLLCDGTIYNTSVFANLAALLGDTWGGDGVTTFAVPDFRGRVLLGAREPTYPVGSYGGTDNVVLTVANMPNHTHAFIGGEHTHAIVDPGHDHTVTDPTHTHTITDPGHVHSALVAATTNTAGAAADSAVAGNTGSATTGVTVDAAAAGVTVDSAATGITTGPAGEGFALGTSGESQPFANLPPYAAVNYIIKT
jgi:microcystin-dependent protein